MTVSVYSVRYSLLINPPWKHLLLLCLTAGLAITLVVGHRLWLSYQASKLPASFMENYYGHWEGEWNHMVKFSIKLSPASDSGKILVHYRNGAYPELGLQASDLKTKADYHNHSVRYEAGGYRSHYWFENGRLLAQVVGPNNATAKLKKIEESTDK